MKHKIVRKSNFLIEASYRLSLAEQRIILLLASMIKIEDKEFKSYQLNIREFADFLSVKNKNNYSQLKNITKKLLTRVLTITRPDYTLQTNWLSSVKYLHGKGEVQLCFDPKLKPFLLQLKERFTSCNLKEIIQLKSFFSVRIYELLKQYEPIGKRIFELTEFRKYLGLKKDEYPYYGNIKQRILLKAQKELAEKTDISFEFKEIKEGRSVQKISFKIFSNKRNSLGLPFTPNLAVFSNTPEEINTELKELFEMLPKVFQNKKTIEKLITESLNKYGFDYVSRNILYTNENSKAAKPGLQNAKGSNYRNYLSKALVGDFGLAYQEDLEAASIVEKEEIAKAAEETEKQRKENAKIEAERDFAIQAKNYIESLDFEAKKIIEEEAIKSLSPEDQQMLSEGRVQAKFTLKTAMKKIVQERLNLTPKK